MSTDKNVQQSFAVRNAHTRASLLSRRQVARTALTSVGVLALTSTLSACAPKHATEMHEQTKVTKTISCDVLVIGGGGAGVSAAAAAAQHGASTILIEKMPWLAGSSSLALGTFYGAGTQLQKKAGIKDSPAGLLEYFMRRGGQNLNYDVQKFCAEHFGETIDWLTGDLKVPFRDVVSLKGTDTVPRGHNCKVAAIDALRAVAALARDAKVQFHFNTAAKELVMNDDGSVGGVLAFDSNQQLVRYSAKNTIMATGGFCRNDQMISTYMPDYAGVYTEVATGLTGEGLQMGLDKGAAYIGHGGTNGILSCAVEPGQSKLINRGALWVNSRGERFANEAGQPHDIYYQVAKFPDRKFFAIYDEAAYARLSDKLRKQMQRGIKMGIVTKANTIKEAADKLGIQGDVCAETLAAYNASCQRGNDAQFNKKPEFLKSLTQAPFYVITLGICTHGSFGGYNVNTRFEVLDKRDNPIPHFYAVGEVSCGTFIYDDYPSGGCGLNWAYTSGRFAGEYAAQNKVLA